MAKKMLINADMLLATPRTFEKKPIVEIGEEVVSPIVPEPLSIEKQIIEVVTSPIADKKDINSVQRGLKPGETRATFIVQETALDKIKAVAYWDRCNIKEVINAAFDAYIKDYEQKNGSIQSIP
jgi:hypothetical protein